MNKVIEEKVIPDMSPRLILLPSRTVHHCQICGTWCNEVYNHTYDCYEYHCYHHGIVAEVHKEPMPVSPDIIGHMDDRGDIMVEAYCSICGVPFLRRKGSSKDLCNRHYYQHYTRTKRDKKGKFMSENNASL